MMLTRVDASWVLVGVVLDMALGAGGHDPGYVLLAAALVPYYLNGPIPETGEY